MPICLAEPVRQKFTIIWCYYRLGYLCFKFILYKRWTRVYLITNEMLSEDNPSDSAVSLAFPAFSACSTTRHFP